MTKLLNFKKLTKGFSLIEVVVSLLSLSITFTAFSLLLDQNLKAQLQKEKYIYKTTKEINLLTLYSNKSSTDDVSLKKFLGVKKEREKILSSFGIRREIEIIFIDGDKEIKINIIRYNEKRFHNHRSSSCSFSCIHNFINVIRILI